MYRNPFTPRFKGLLQAAIIGLAVPTLAFGATMSSADYRAAKDRAATEYKAAKARCDAMTGNPKDVCIAQAKANEKKAKAEAEANYKHSDKARRDANVPRCGQRWIVCWELAADGVTGAGNRW